MVARTASVTVKLLDQLTAPARIIGNSLRALRGDMNALAGAKLGIDKQIAAATARIKEARTALIGTTAAAVAAVVSLRRVTRSGIELETVLTDIRQKSDLTSEGLAILKGRIQAIAPTVNKSAGEIAKGVDFLMSAGLDPDRAMAIMPAIGKAATAYRAEIENLAKAGFAAMDNLKVPANEFAKTLDIMASAGNAGNFELKDMATYFPQLTAAAEALGMKGNAGVAKLAAALQVARKGAGDASSAATNTANLMQKIISPETTKNFKKHGVDIRKELKKIQKEGGDPFVMISELTKKALKGDMSKLGDLFQDAQVQQFLRPLIANPDFYKKTRDDAENATGIVDKDYARRMETLQERINRLMTAFDTLSIKITDALTPYLGALADAVVPLANYLGEVVGKYPEYVAAIAGVTAGLIGLAAALGALKLFGAALSLFSFKGLRGMLNYLAPKGGGAAAATSSGAGGGVGAVGASAGKIGTGARPGAMSPSQLQAAKQGVANMNAPATALGRFVGGLKNGVVGGLAYYFGTKAIDAGFDALPKPEYPAGYDPKAEMNMSFLERFSRMWNGYREESAKNGPKPIEPADMERWRQGRREFDASNPEHRRAMMAPDTGGKTAGVAAGSEFGQGIREGLSSTRAAFSAEVESIIAEAQAKLSAAGLSLTITPKVAGLGPALRSIHADVGI